MPLVLNIAHRGGAGLAPENSLAAFQKALSLGVDGVELDVHLWNDECVVVHDDPAGPVRPLFREVLELLRPHPVQLFAECKAIPRSYPGIEEKMIRLVEEFELVERTIFGSFDHARVVAAKKIQPALRTAVLSSNRLHDPGRYVREIGADLYAPGTDGIGLRSLHGRIHPDIFESCRRAGIPVWVYTVNDPHDMRKVIDAGASAIFTDYPDRLRSVLHPV